jgi:hypothetical protein
MRAKLQLPRPYGRVSVNFGVRRQPLPLPPRCVVALGMRLALLLPVISFITPAFAESSDVYIPQCDRAHEQCIKEAVTSDASRRCRDTRQACRAATIDEAVKNSGMSVSQLLDSTARDR